MSFRINTNVSAMNAMRNLSMTGMSLAQSVTRLSTGLRINNAGDDPSGLIASEKFRAQIAGMDQALKNNQDALNYAKTAEGALDEVNRLLRDARSLAVAYSGSLDSSQLQANQDQLNSIMASIDRIATNTQFGTKKLLDGSSGVNATVVNGTALKSVSIGGTIGTQSITANAAVTVDVTTAATKAAHTGTNAIAAASEAAYLAAAVGADAGSFAVNGISITATATDTWGDVINKINEVSGQTGVRANSTYGGGNGAIVLTQNSYGANHKINLTDSVGIIQAAAGSATASGVNAVADVTVGALTAVTFTGGQNGNDGLTMTDAAGNRVVLTEAGNAVATLAAAAQVTAGSASFQIGAFAGQTTSLSLSSVSSSSLSLTSLDVTSSSNATAAQTALDTAIDTVSRMRGNVGSFMRNTLESNIRSLGVAKENLTATESAIRDVDIADEMATFTKLQILQQSGLAVLAQANSTPQSVLGLLR
jgi:flagellin